MIEREVDFGPDETRRLAEMALLRIDRIYEYTVFGRSIKAVGMTRWNKLGNPLRGLVGTILNIDIEPSEDGSGSTISVWIEAARKGAWGPGSELVLGIDEGLLLTFLGEFDTVIDCHQDSGTVELYKKDLRSSNKYTGSLGSRHRKLMILTTFGFITIFMILLYPGSFVVGAELGDPSHLLHALVLSVFVTWGLKRLLNL